MKAPLDISLKFAVTKQQNQAEYETSKKTIHSYSRYVEYNNSTFKTIPRNIIIYNRPLIEVHVHQAFTA